MENHSDSIPFDSVNNPEHYNAGTIECIDAIQAQFNRDEYRGFLKGNVVKYLWRESKKGGLESLEKAEWYLHRLIQLDRLHRTTKLMQNTCKDGFCPMPNVRYDQPMPAADSPDHIVFPPIS